MEGSPDPNSVTAQRTQEKLDFYVVALSFTVLGLSIQTAIYGRNVVADILELASWVLLLSSGVIGLWRIEGKPFLYHLVSLRDDFDSRAKNIRKVEAQGTRSMFSLDQGREISTAEALEIAVTSIAKIDEKLEPWQKTLGRRYNAQRWSLVAGFGCLVMARALVPVVGIVQRLGLFFGHVGA